jgi:hypothetical protein
VSRQYIGAAAADKLLPQMSHSCDRNARERPSKTTGLSRVGAIFGEGASAGSSSSAARLGGEYAACPA